MIGQRFGRLLVVSPSVARARRRCWECRCDCGKTVAIRGTNLRSGNTTSCGCRREEVRRARATTHGKTRSSAYWRWRQMIQRCTNAKNQAYADYGGRGIRVCARWRTFSSFYLDMGDPPDGATLDRIDVNGDYEPSNCRWATRERQARNTRKTPMLTHDGRTQSLMDWAEEFGIDMHTLHSRLDRGWPVAKALTASTNREPTLTYRGERKTLSEWATDLGVTRDALANRLKRGWAPDRIFTQPFRKSPRMRRRVQ